MSPESLVMKSCTGCVPLDFDNKTYSRNTSCTITLPSIGNLLIRFVSVKPQIKIITNNHNHYKIKITNLLNLYTPCTSDVPDTTFSTDVNADINCSADAETDYWTI